MQAERSRSHPGFETLPSVASTLPPQQLPTHIPSGLPQEAPVQQHPLQQPQPVPLQQQTIQQNTQQQISMVSTQQQHVQIPSSYRPQQPRFTTPPGFMPWPRMPAPFNPWAARAAPPQFTPRPPPQIQAQPQQVVQPDQGPQQPPMEFQPPLQNPGAWGGGGDDQTGYDQEAPQQQVLTQQDQYTPGPGQLSPSDIEAIRNILPNLCNLSDAFIASTPMPTLIQMNQQAQQAPQAGDMQAAMIAAAAAAAQYSQMAGFNPTVQDPGIKMAKNLEKLRTNPVTVQEGQDNRITILHDARFLAGAVTSGTGMWLAARKVIGLEGLTPLANYDLACIGLSGSVTTKGCIEAHNPGSQNLCLKMFSPENLSTTAGAARKFTLADDDGAISVGEHMKEITEMATLQHAMRALCGLTRLIMPWNLSFEAIHGFLYATNFGLPELKDDPLRVPKLVKFINYVLGVNAAAWQREEPFLTCGNLKQEFGTYLQCQVSGAFIPAVAQTPPQQNNNNQKGGRGRGGHFGGGGGRGGFQYSNRGGGGRGGGRGGFQYGGGRGGFQYSGGRGGYQHSGGGTGGSSGQDGSSGSIYATLPSGYYGPNGYVILCKNYNAGRCKTQGATCILPSGATANHLCGARNANGDICKAQHPAIGHN